MTSSPSFSVMSMRTLVTSPGRAWARERISAGTDGRSGRAEVGRRRRCRAEQGGGHRQRPARGRERTESVRAGGDGRTPGRATQFAIRTICQGYRRDPTNLVHGVAQSGCAERRYTARAVRVDQVIPSLASRDAIGVHTLNLRDGLRAAGIDSDIFYGSHTPDVAARGPAGDRLGRSGRDRWLLYQASIGSPVYDIFAARAEPKLVNYHNITPPACCATGSPRWPTRSRWAAPSWPAWRRRAASPWPTLPSTSPSSARSATRAPLSCRC